MTVRTEASIPEEVEFQVISRGLGVSPLQGDENSAESAKPPVLGSSDAFARDQSQVLGSISEKSKQGPDPAASPIIKTFQRRPIKEPSRWSLGRILLGHGIDLLIVASLAVGIMAIVPRLIPENGGVQKDIMSLWTQMSADVFEASLVFRVIGLYGAYIGYWVIFRFIVGNTIGEITLGALWRQRASVESTTA